MSQGRVNSKLILVAMVGLIAGLSLFINYKQEKKDLLRQLKATARQKEEISRQRDEVLKSISPLRDEIRHMQVLLANNQKDSGPEEGQAKSVLPLEGQSDTLKPEKAPIALKGKKVSSRSRSGPGVDIGAKMSNAEKGLSRLKDYVKDLESQNTLLKEKINQSNGLLDTKENDLLKLNNQNIKLAGDLEKVLKVESQLRADFEENIKSLNTMKAQLASQEADIQSSGKIKIGLENQLKELNNKLSAMAETNASLEKQIASQQEAKASLAKELDKIKEDSGRQLALNESLGRKVSEITEALGNKEKEAAAITRELEQLKEARRNLETEVNELRLVKSANESQINQLNLRINESKLSYESVRDAMSQLSNLLTKKEIEASQKQIEAHSLKEDFDRAAEEKSSLATALKDKEKNVADLNSALSQMESQLTELKAQLDMPKKLQAKTMEQVNELTSVSNLLQEKLSGVSKELQTLSSQSQEDKKKADDLKKRVEVMLDVEK